MLNILFLFIKFLFFDFFTKFPSGQALFFTRKTKRYVLFIKFSKGILTLHRLRHHRHIHAQPYIALHLYKGETSACLFSQNKRLRSPLSLLFLLFSQAEKSTALFRFLDKSVILGPPQIGSTPRPPLSSPHCRRLCQPAAYQRLVKTPVPYESVG